MSSLCTCHINPIKCEWCLNTTETNAERLERIKRIVLNDKANGINVSSWRIETVEFLVEQAERVQEIELENKNLHSKLRKNGGKYRRELNDLKMKNTQLNNDCRKAENEATLLSWRKEEVETLNKRLREALKGIITFEPRNFYNIDEIARQALEKSP